MFIEMRIFDSVQGMAQPTPKSIDPAQLVPLAAAVVRADKFPVLATVDEDQPRVRPVSPVKTDGFVIYVANLRQYNKTAEIAANPKVELCYMDEGHNQVRITGFAEIVEDSVLLQEIWDSNPLLRQYLGTPDNPELIIYQVNPVRVRYMQEWALEYYEVPFRKTVEA
jgi:general stress protein 26